MPDLPIHKRGIQALKEAKRKINHGEEFINAKEGES